MRTLSFLLAPAAIAFAGCAPVPPYSPTPEARAELNKLISGKVAGTPMTCLAPYRANDMVTIDDNTIAFRMGSTVYVNRIQGGCSGLARGHYALVTRSIGPGLCSGDIAQVADLTTGMTVGSCALGEFVPYRAP